MSKPSHSASASKKRAPLRHVAIEKSIEGPSRKKRATAASPGGRNADSGSDDEEYIETIEDLAGAGEGGSEGARKMPAKTSSRMLEQAREQRRDIFSEEMTARGGAGMTPAEAVEAARKLHGQAQIESDEEFDDEGSMDEDDEGEEGLVNIDGEYVEGMDLAEGEEDIVRRFLGGGEEGGAGRGESLADIIMNKIREKEAGAGGDANGQGQLSPKVVEVYTAVGKMLAHYKSGKLPKALKMLPHLKNWEEVLWLTRPDQWTPSAIYACTRIFASNLNVKMAQRFFNMVLLESCRDDIATNRKLNYHLYMALKKALFKPAAFYKGVLLPLCASRTCTLREATIFGSVIAKVSVPAIHSAAALMKLTQMPYSGSNSMFIRILLSKKYALPRRVLAALVEHFYSFIDEKRELPVVWHQALLVFAQRYKLDLDDTQKHSLRDLVRVQNHHLITAEVRRELFGRDSTVGAAAAESAPMAVTTDSAPASAAGNSSGGMMLMA